jgi:hypothetical protein
MPALSAHKLIIAAQVAVACVFTLLALDLTRALFGRPALWFLGLAFLCLAFFGLFRIGK